MSEHKAWGVDCPRKHSDGPEMCRVCALKAIEASARALAERMNTDTEGTQR